MENRKECSPNLLILSGMLMVVLGGLGRYTFSTVMSELIAARGYAKAEAGMVSASLFFCYAIVQVLAARFYKKLPVRILSVTSIISAIANFLMPAVSLPVMVVLWAINGIATSVTFMIVVEMFSLYLPKEKLVVSGACLGFSTSSTKLVLYGFAAISTTFLDWRWVFWGSAVVMVLVAVYWYWFIGRYHKNTLQTGREETAAAPMEKKTFAFWLVFCVNVIAAIACTFSSNISVSWLPIILREDFLMDQSVIYLLMIGVVCVGLFSSILTSLYIRLSKNYPLLQSGMFVLLAAVSLSLAVFGNANRLAFFLLCCLSVLLFSYAVSHIATTYMALRCRNYVSAGAFFAIMNAGSSVGICICDYGIGSALDASPWQTVFKIVFAVAASTAVLVAVSAFRFKKLKE